MGKRRELAWRQAYRSAYRLDRPSIEEFVFRHLILLCGRERDFRLLVRLIQSGLGHDWFWRARAGGRERRERFHERRAGVMRGGP